MEVPLEADQCPLVAAKYKAAATGGLFADFIVPIPLLLDTDTVMNLIHLEFLPKFLRLFSHKLATSSTKLISHRWMSSAIFFFAST